MKQIFPIDFVNNKYRLEQFKQIDLLFSIDKQNF